MERDLQVAACPPKSMSCNLCRNNPLYGLTMCRICGNCKRRSMLEEMLSAFNSPTTAQRVTLETSDIDPMADFVCTQVADDIVQADIKTLAEEASFTAFASGLDPVTADFKVYMCNK